MITKLKELRWNKFPALNDGFVCLVDMMGDDSSVVQAARVSYGEGTTKVSDDRALIRYLMRQRHTTPFEMVELKFLVRVPMDCWRQWIRHRTASVNEYSTRYSEAIDSCQTTNPDEWRVQSKKNKQGSEEFIPTFSPTDKPGTPGYDKPFDEWEGAKTEDGFPFGGDELTDEEGQLHTYTRRCYQARLDAGVSREQARKDLPLSNYTEAYWKINLHNLFHFLGLRMAPDAQKEIREYATIIGEQIVKPLLPLCWEAFSDYRLNGMVLSRLDIEVMDFLQRHPLANKTNTLHDTFSNKRERAECVLKLEKLGVIVNET